MSLRTHQELLPLDWELRMWSPLCAGVPVVCWLDSAIFTADGQTASSVEDDPVNTWTDKSGFGYHAGGQGTGSNVPNLEGYGDLGGDNWVRFSDANTEYAVLDHMPEMEVGTGDFTIILCMRQAANDSTANQRVLQKPSWESVYGPGYEVKKQGILIQQKKETANTREAIIGDVSNSLVKVNLRDGAATTLDDQARIYSLVRTSGTAKGYTDGTLEDTETSAQNINDRRASPSQVFHLGKDPAVDEGDTEANLKCWNGYLAELIICPHAFTDSDRERMEGYLAHKWGGSGETYTDLVDKLPAGHRWKAEAPTGPLGLHKNGSDNRLSGGLRGECIGDLSRAVDEVS